MKKNERRGGVRRKQKERPKGEKKGEKEKKKNDNYCQPYFHLEKLENKIKLSDIRILFFAIKFFFFFEKLLIIHFP